MLPFATPNAVNTVTLNTPCYMYGMGLIVSRYWEIQWYLEYMKIQLGNELGIVMCISIL
jgi:hypothetical protein